MKENDVEANPLDRGHQDKIVMLKQELSVIIETLEDQHRVIMDSQATSMLFPHSRYVPAYERGYQHYASKAAPSFHHRGRGQDVNDYITTGRPRRRATYESRNVDDPNTNAFPGSQGDMLATQDILFQDSLAFINKRIHDFDEIHQWASHLESWVWGLILCSMETGLI